MTSVHHLPIPERGEVYFKLQPRLLTVSEELQQHYTFDAEGRFLSAFLDGKNYRRALDGSVLLKHASGVAPKARRFLSDAEQRHLLDDVRGRVAHIRAHLPAEYADLRERLDLILAWDAARLLAERERFAAVYRPVGILPPDQYLSVVVQAAEGCSWNHCTFCTFYRDRRFRIKSPDEFRQHARQVKTLLGASIGLRKSLFLGDANALIIPQRRLLELLRVAREEFPIDAPQPGQDYVLRGIYSFLDIFGAEHKTLDDYRALRDLGVRRVYIGLETGDAEVFALLNKPGAPQACVEAVQTIRQAGIDVGIILLAGAGGAELAAQHSTHSVQAVAAMGLGARDVVYISPLIVSADNEYAHRMRARGLRLLERAEVDAQVETLKATLQGVAAGGPKVALYHIEEFSY